MEKFRVKCGVGFFEVYPADEVYGGINVDLVIVGKNGDERTVPIATFENPVDPSVDDASCDAVFGYIFEDMNLNEFTTMVEIPIK